MEVYDVLGMGNALVDVIVHVDDAFLEREAMVKGSMQLVEADLARELYDRLPPGIEVSGGSGANTIAGVASLGGRAVYIGKVADDQMGQVFAHDLRATGVHFPPSPATSGTPTGRCLVVVTPDAQRTMHTYLGAGLELTPDDVDPDLVAAAQVTFLEGYLWDPPLAKEAFLKAARIARQSGRRVSLTLSDTFCVARHRAEFLDLVEHHVDVLFANERELLSLYETDSLEDAIGNVRGTCEIAVVTRSERGSIIITDGDTHVIEASPVERVVDTTGAGDLYAAGFLFGLTHGKDLPACGRIASIAAAEVIGHLGARPETPLSELVAAVA